MAVEQPSIPPHSLLYKQTGPPGILILIRIATIPKTGHNTSSPISAQPSYHYYIRMDGDVIPTLPENIRGAHARHYNRCSIGVCYEGGINAKGKADDTRTEAQKKAKLELLKDLRGEYPEARIIGHRELPHVAKDCPCFDAASEFADLNENLY